MSLVLAGLEQGTRQNVVKGSNLLLEFINSEWKSFDGSSAHTMRNCLVIPPDIQRVAIQGVEYDLINRKREIWFPRTDTSYNGSRVFVTELVDELGQSWQLELDRSRGNSLDDLVLVRARRLRVSYTLGEHRVSGRVRD
jgi:hypothetical protein